MKAKELRDLSLGELKKKLVEKDKELFNLRMRHQFRQLKDTSQLIKVRRDIARIKTIIWEKEHAT